MAIAVPVNPQRRKVSSRCPCRTALAPPGPAVRRTPGVGAQPARRLRWTCWPLPRRGARALSHAAWHRDTCSHLCPQHSPGRIACVSRSQPHDDQCGQRCDTGVPAFQIRPGMGRPSSRRSTKSPRCLLDRQTCGELAGPRWRGLQLLAVSVSMNADISGGISASTSASVSCSMMAKAVVRSTVVNSTIKEYAALSRAALRDCLPPGALDDPARPAAQLLELIVGGALRGRPRAFVLSTARRRHLEVLPGRLLLVRRGVGVYTGAAEVAAASPVACCTATMACWTTARRASQ